MKKYIDDMFDRNFIKLNTFSYVASILIIKKLDERFRVCVDYKVLNNFIIKNRNVFSLIKDTLARLYKIKWYNKFDIIVVFNEIRMRENDEKKTIFLTRYELFEYVVMLFDFCNAFETFQTFINVIFKKYLNDFCFEYFDDILIYNKTRDDCYDSRNSNDEIIIVMKSCSTKSRVSTIIIDLTSETNIMTHELDKRALLVDSFNEQMSKTRRLDKWAHEHDSLTHFASKRVNKFLLLYKISTWHFLKVRVQLI